MLWSSESLDGTRQKDTIEGDMIEVDEKTRIKCRMNARLVNGHSEEQEMRYAQKEWSLLRAGDTHRRNEDQNCLGE